MKSSHYLHNHSIHRIKTVRRLWLIHFCLGIIIVILGMISNGGNRKYISLKNVHLNFTSSILLPPNMNIHKQVEVSTLTQIDDSSDSLEYYCTKAYVNVFSSSPFESNAVICCDNYNSNNHHPYQEEEEEGGYYSKKYFSYQAVLCQPWSIQFPLAKSLLDFPHIWILPLIPILLRIIFDLYRLGYLKIIIISSNNNKMMMMMQQQQQQYYPTTVGTSHSLSIIKARLVNSIRRLLFYHLIMQFRGWGLYTVLEKIEDILIIYYFTSWSSPQKSYLFSLFHSYHKNRTTKQQHLHHLQNSLSSILSEEEEEKDPSTTCWYSSLLTSSPSTTVPSSSTSSSSSSTIIQSFICKGKEFDFSDHIVYFYSHVLPILLFEALFTFLFPFHHHHQQQQQQYDYYHQGKEKEEENDDDENDDDEKDGVNIDIVKMKQYKDTPIIHHTKDTSSFSTKILLSEKNKTVYSPLTLNILSTSSITTMETTIDKDVKLHNDKYIHHHHRTHNSIHSLVVFVIQAHIQVLHSLVILIFHWIVPPFLVLAFLYFNFLTFLAIYSTAAVYHTIHEVIVGYMISLVVQLPLGILLCTEKWPRVRSWIGLATFTTSTNTDTTTIQTVCDNKSI